MRFSKLYIQKNFVPNIAQDQYGRESIGVEMTLEEGDDLNEAKEVLREYIKDYIEAHTVISHAHVEERYIPENQLPIIRYD